jgi:hypothetical protein
MLMGFARGRAARYYDRIELPPDAHWFGDMSKLPHA